MNLHLEKLEIHNFEGGTLSIEFGKKTTIKGANRAGKSRVKDAYHWLLTGRNADDQAQFDIKDTVNVANNRLPHTVIGHFIKDGQPLTLERSYVELHGSDKGEAEERLKGHTVNYKINGNVKVAKEFNEMLSMIIPANLMKMVSDPLYFPNMKWDEQRKVLELMAADVTNESMIEKLATPENDLSEIIAVLNAGDTLEIRKTRIAYEIKKAKDSHAIIKPKIDENIVSINALPSIHIAAVNAEVSRLNDEIEKIDSQITDKVAAKDEENNSQRTQRNRMNALTNRNDEILNAFVRAVNLEKQNSTAGKVELENEIEHLKADHKSKTALISSLGLKNTSIKEQGKGLATRFEDENKKLIPDVKEDLIKCPTCGRFHDEADIEETKLKWVTNFKEQKKKTLLALNNEGAALGAQLAENAKMIEQATKNLETVTQQLNTKTEEYNALVEKINSQSAIVPAEDRLHADPEYIKNVQEINSITETLQTRKPIDYTELKTKKNALIAQLDAEKLKLNSVEEKKKLEERNNVHAETEKTLAQQIATLEREQLQINKFIVAQMDAIEESIRSKFKYVRFKMFDQNIGDQTIKPFCEAWFEGKPYSALNTEAKLNAGLDIINALSKHYNTYAPILLDNRESTTEVIEVESQLISFFVDPKHKVLDVLVEAED